MRQSKEKTKKMEAFEPFDFEQIASCYLELASEQRLKILHMLSQNHSERVVDIAKKLDITSQETYRNLERLEQQGFVKKSSKSKYKLTKVSQILVNQVPFLSFLTRNKEFLESHHFGDIPGYFLLRLGAFDGSEFLDKVTDVIEKWNKVNANAKRYVHSVLPEAPANINKIIEANLSKKAKIKLIVSKEVKRQINKTPREDKGFVIGIPQDFNSAVFLALNEKEGIISIPSTDNAPDLRYAFYSEKPEFREWLHGVFDHYLTKAR